MEDTSYWQESRRIVYLLKEVHVTDTEDAWDLSSFLLDAKRARTWNMVAYWTFGLLNGLPRWVDVPQADENFRRQWLRRIAVVNLNKGGGGASTDQGKLRQIASRDADLLREQLALLDPRVVICCGTGELAAQLLFDGPATRRLESGARLFDSTTAGPVALAVAHPQARRPGSELYASLIDAVRELGLT